MGDLELEELRELEVLRERVLFRSLNKDIFGDRLLCALECCGNLDVVVWSKRTLKVVFSDMVNGKQSTTSGVAANYKSRDVKAGRMQL